MTPSPVLVHPVPTLTSTARPAGTRAGPAARVLIAVVTGYRRWISPLLGPHCRFAPSCSAYTVQALRTHGALRGSWLGARRLLRCHPFHPGGHDPVPPVRRTADGPRPGRLDIPPARTHAEQAAATRPGRRVPHGTSGASPSAPTEPTGADPC